MRPALLAMLLSLIVSYALTPLAARLAWRIGAIHQPGGRRVHTTPTPGFGGFAIFVGFMFAVAVVLAVDRRLTFDYQMKAVLLGGVVIAVMGAVDDKYNLPPILQVIGIVAGACVLIAFGIKIRYVTMPFDAPRLLALNGLAIPITLVWVFGVTKTIDLIDGLDGLASGICAIAGTTLLLMAAQARSHGTDPAAFQKVALMAGALVGASLGFLRHNYPPAKIFMGTIGAQFMGFVLASISIVGAFKVATLAAVAVPVFALGVPIIDAMFVVLRRFLDRRPLAEADKSHVHHRLLERGLSHGQVVLIIYALTIILSAAALTFYAVSQ